VSRQITFSDISTEEVLLDYLRTISKKLEKDLINLGNIKAKTISLTTKSNDFKLKNKAITLLYPISKENEIYTNASNILHTLLPLNLRLIGIRLSHLENIPSQVPSNTISKYFPKMTQSQLESPTSTTTTTSPLNDKISPKRKSLSSHRIIPKSKKRKSDPGQTTLDRFFPQN